METPINPFYSGVIGYLHKHPILLLLFLTPGIPEYLSGSSKMAALVQNPSGFFIFLALNLALYGPGVILIREAALRWKKGWGTVITLGAAYAILEEGFALRTMFTNDTSNLQPDGILAFYGRWLGINWVWSAGILIVHIVFSISLPIMLFGLTFPDLKTRTLVSKRRIAVLLGILFADSLLLIRLEEIIEPYRPSVGIYVATILVMLTLVLIAWKLPANLLRKRTLQPTRRPLVFGILGILVLPLAIIVGGRGADVNAPPMEVIAFDLVSSLLLLAFLLRSLGSLNNEKQKIALATGLIIPIALFGFIVGIGVPVVALADLWMALYLRGLWRNYRARVYVGGLQLPPPQLTAG